METQDASLEISDLMAEIAKVSPMWKAVFDYIDHDGRGNHSERFIEDDVLWGDNRGLYDLLHLMQATPVCFVCDGKLGDHTIRNPLTPKLRIANFEPAPYEVFKIQACCVLGIGASEFEKNFSGIAKVAYDDRSERNIERFYSLSVRPSSCLGTAQTTADGRTIRICAIVEINYTTKNITDCPIPVYTFPLFTDGSFGKITCMDATFDFRTF